MGGRGARSGGGGGAATILPGGGAATILPGGGAATIIPPGQQDGNLAGAGSGVSDVNSHTTYFPPGDALIVNSQNTLGTRYSPNNGQVNNIGYYNTGDYYNINTELREMAAGKRQNLTPQTQTVVDAMDRNMRPLNKPMDTVRWTTNDAIASNLNMEGASRQTIINRLKGGDIIAPKNDFTSSSWDVNNNTVNGSGGRYVKLNMHYAKGAMGQFSPTGMESEFVGARGVMQRFSNARMEQVYMTNPRTGRSGWNNCLVLDCYVN